MARGAHEISRLIGKMGGNPLSAYGLCHLGDYEATLFSKWSHNRMYGEAFVSGNKFEKLAEGVMTTKALVKLSQEYDVDMPIVRACYNVLFEDKKVEDAIDELFDRKVKREFRIK